MSTYTPDFWKIVEFTSPKHGKVQKVFATWGGGYLYGSSWKLSSGNLAVQDTGNTWTISQESGSVYVLDKQSEGIQAHWVHMLDEFQKLADRGKGSFKVLDIKDI